MVWLVFYLWNPFVMCTNEKKPHPWCENTVSHHGVNLVGSLNKLPEVNPNYGNFS